MTATPSQIFERSADRGQPTRTRQRACNKKTIIIAPIALQELAFPVFARRPSYTNSHLCRLSKRGPSPGGSGHILPPLLRLTEQSSLVGRFHSRSGGSGRTAASNLAGTVYRDESWQEYALERNVPLEFCFVHTQADSLCQQERLRKELRPLFSFYPSLLRPSSGLGRIVVTFCR